MSALELVNFCDYSLSGVEGKFHPIARAQSLELDARADFVTHGHSVHVIFDRARGRSRFRWTAGTTAMILPLPLTSLAVAGGFRDARYADTSINSRSVILSVKLVIGDVPSGL